MLWNAKVRTVTAMAMQRRQELPQPVTHNSDRIEWRKAENLPLILESMSTSYYSLSPETIATAAVVATTVIDSLVLGLDPSDG